MELKEKVIEHLEKLGFYGIDDSLEESLFEYGLICKKDKYGEYYFIYEINGSQFLYQNGYITDKEIDAFLEESWFNTDSFLSYVGLSKIGFITTSAVNKVYSYLQYHGYENIFGMADYDITLADLAKME